MGHPAQSEENGFVEQRADDDTFGGDDLLGLRGDSGDLDLGDGLQRSGICVEDLVGRREVQFVERVEGGRECSSVGAIGAERPAGNR